MAFTRRFLKEVLADREDAAELIDQIIEAHLETVTPIKAELNRLQEENGGKTADEIHAEVECIEAEIGRIKAGSVDENGKPWKTRYEEQKAQYEAYRAAEKEEAAYRKKQSAYREILTSCNVPYRLRELILEADRNTINSLEVFDGKVRDLEGIKASIMRDYGEFVPRTNTVRSSGYATRSDIMAIGDRAERMAERNRHPSLFDRS